MSQLVSVVNYWLRTELMARGIIASILLCFLDGVFVSTATLYDILSPMTFTLLSVKDTRLRGQTLICVKNPREGQIKLIHVYVNNVTKGPRE